jgi:hypothetical protein
MMKHLRDWKWQLAAFLVAVAVGVWFATRPTPHPVDSEIGFVDATDAAGIRFTHVSGRSPKKLLPETMGSGVAVIDFDRDGLPDLFFVNSREWEDVPNAPTHALYRNKGDGTFEDVTKAVGLDVVMFGLGVAVGDFDNDGYPDLFVTAVGGNHLFRNVGGKRFADVSATAGFNPTPNSFPSSAVFLDYDNDGRLDLFVCNYLTWSPEADTAVPATLPGGVRAYVPPQQFPPVDCDLWRNIDGTRFERVGVHVPEHFGSGGGKSLGVVVCDPDGDGWPDIAVANDTTRNFLFHNNVSPVGTRHFIESALFAGIAYADGRPRGGMGIDAAEILPGTTAVLIANFTNEPNSLFQLQGKNPIRFGDVATEVGLAGVSRHAMKFGAMFFDADRDGRPDLFTANGHLEPDIKLALPGQTYPQAAQLFRNTGKPNALFAEVGNPFPPMVGRGCAYLDYDGDGKLDIVVTENGGRARLFRNTTNDEHHFIRFVLTGNGKTTNRDAIGAEVTVWAGDLVQRRSVTGAHGYLSSSDLAPFFGLGTATSADRVTVRWPGSGTTQEWRNLAAGGTHHLTEGEPEAKRK